MHAHMQFYFRMTNIMEPIAKEYLVSEDMGRKRKKRKRHVAEIIF